MNINLSLPVIVWKENKYYIAYSPVLDIVTQGDSIEDAKKMFTEAVQIHIEEMIKDGVLEEELQSLGWKKVNGNFEPPVNSQQIETSQVDVPVVMSNAQTS